METMMNISDEEINRIWLIAKQRMRRSRRTRGSRRSGNKQCQFTCCGTIPDTRTTSPTEGYTVPDITNLPPSGMSPEFWWFLGLKRRESDDMSCSNTEAHNVMESSTQLSETSDLSFSHAEYEPQLQMKEETKPVLIEHETLNRTSVIAVDKYAADELTKVIVDAVQRWKETTAESTLVLPETIAKIAYEVALNTVQQLELTEAKKTEDSEAKSTQAKENFDVMEVKRSLSMSPGTVSTTYSDKENMLMKFEDGSDSEVRDKKQMVPIGGGNALVPAYLLKTINWNLYKIATRKLLQAVFGRSVLATHNLTGKASPAFPGRLPKAKLDEALVNDIVQTVAERCGVTENIVRTCITIKCADEGKWLRREQAKQKRKSKEDPARFERAPEE